MTCPKCTGLMVIETVTCDGGLQFDHWRCVNCGKRETEETMRTRSAAAIAKYKATMAEKRAVALQEAKVRAVELGLPEPTPKKPALTVVPKVEKPKVFERVTVRVGTAGTLVERGELPDDAFQGSQGFPPIPVEVLVAPCSPAVRELDALIDDLDRQLAETRGVRQLLVQRQVSA